MSLIGILLVVIAMLLAIALFHRRRAHRSWEEAREKATWLNRELERTDSRLEVVEIWSDEQLDRHDRKLANSILEKVGTDLLADESTEATRLRTFLGKIRQTDSGDPNSPRDMGLAWFACLQIQDKDPASELAQLFKVLNDAWTASRDGKAKLAAPDQQTILRSITATLIQSRSQP